MTLDQIHQVLGTRPWRGMEVRVDNGDVYRIGHPDNIVIREDFIFIVVGDGTVAILGPEAVSAIVLGRKNGRGRASRVH